MKTTFYLKLCCFLAAFWVLIPAAFSQTYNWLSWTFPGGQTASANASGFGSIGLSVQGDSMQTTPFTIQFDNVAFTPTIAESVAAGSTLFARQLWALQIDFSSVADTTGLIVGLGNFGHGTLDYPGYRLTAFDRLGRPVSLSAFTQIGSYDHTWISPAWPSAFNDDVSLNPATGLFEVTTTPGGDDFNSDILLLSLPGGVGQISILPVEPAAGESINVVVAVPEPGTLALVLLGIGALSSLKWRRNAATTQDIAAHLTWREGTDQ